MATNEKNHGLSSKEIHFCEEYILDYNASSAAIRAGYPEKTSAKRGCLLLKRPEVREYILQLQKERSERLTVSADFVIGETLGLLQKCLGNVKPIRVWNYETHQFEESGSYALDSKGAMQCLTLLAKMVGACEPKAAEDPHLAAIAAEVERMVNGDGT